MNSFYYIIIGFLSFISVRTFAQNTQCYYFPFTGSSNNVPCSFNPNTRELFLSGFETDGKGTFWFAGGEPFEVVCFEGTKQVWRRSIPECVVKKGMMHLHSDSLYIVDDVHHAVYAMPANGQGAIRHTSISYPASADKASITGGCFSGGWTEKGFYLEYSRPVVEANGDCSFWHTHTWFYDYTGNTLPYDYTDKNNSHLPEDVRQYMDNVNIGNQQQHFKGWYASYPVYVGWIGGKKTVSLFNNQGKLVHQATVEPDDKKLLEVIGVILNDEAHLPTPNYDLLRSNRVYSVGYSPQDPKNNSNMVVYEYKLQDAFSLEKYKK